MKRVLTAAVLIPIVLYAVFKAPHWVFTLLVGGVALLALDEYLDLVVAYGYIAMRKTVIWVVGSIFLLLGAPQFAHTPITLPIIYFVVFFWVFVFLITAMLRHDLSKVLPSAAMSGLGVFYIGFSMVAVALMQKDWYALIFTFFAVWAGDTVAMYVGKSIGRHKMAPQISPNKTWEGAVGSLVGSVLVCAALAWFAPRIEQAIHPDQLNAFMHDHARLLRLPFVLIGAVVINIAAQVGDLVESAMKRGAHVKDSGRLLPGHGGILDRIDALLFAGPVGFVLLELLR